MSTRVLQGDVFDMLPTIAPGSIDVAVSSPPYWQLRSYLPKDHPLKPRELGAERTPAEFVANMVKVFRLVRDTLAEHGTCWVNIGDSYAGSWGNYSGGNRGKGGQRPIPLGSKVLNPAYDDQTDVVPGTANVDGIPNGNLCLIPQRLAIAFQDDGWFVRSVVIWHKPACMPASLSGWKWMKCKVKVKAQQKGKQDSSLAECGRTRDCSHGTWIGNAEWTDCPGCKKCEPNGGYVLRKGSWRPTSSYEPVIMLAKSDRYFADGEPVKTPPKDATVSRDKYSRVLDDADEQFAVKHDHETECIDGANLRDVWTIASEPLREKHYAAYPSKLVDTILRCSTSAKGYCPECGKPWVRMMDKPMNPSKGLNIGEDMTGGAAKTGNAQTSKGLHRNGGNAQGPPGTTVGWRASCEHHDLEPRPGRVLDPFGGSGRTAIAAGRLGLDAVLCELNPEYAEMSRRLIHNESPLFADVA